MIDSQEFCDFKIMNQDIDEGITSKPITRFQKPIKINKYKIIPLPSPVPVDTNNPIYNNSESYSEIHRNPMSQEDETLSKMGLDMNQKNKKLIEKLARL